MALNKFVRSIFCVLILCFVIPSSFLLGQEKIGGRDVLKGRWKNQEIEYVQGQIAVILKPGRSKANVQTALDNHRATVVREFDKLGWGLIEIPKSEDIFSLIQELEKNEPVEVAEPNLVDRIQFDPNDPYFSDGTQWALKNTGQTPPGGTNDADIDAPEAWNTTMGNPSIIIAILDTGIPMINGALSHQDLNDPNKVILGPDYAGGGDGVTDWHSHGSHVAGIASAETNNSTGISGVAGSCKVLIIQTFNQAGSGLSEWFRDGVIYAVDNGAKVINYSGGGNASSTKEQGVQYARDHNVLLVAASGNTNGAIIYPAAYSSSYNIVIAVGATDHNDQRASYSNYGSALNVVAPGGSGTSYIFSTTPNYPGYFWEDIVSQNYGYIRGTSQAAPHVSGLAALFLSINSTLLPSQIRDILQQAADKVSGMGGQNFTNEYGYGRIHAYQALLLAHAYSNKSMDATATAYSSGRRLVRDSSPSGPLPRHFCLRWGDILP